MVQSIEKGKIMKTRSKIFHVIALFVLLMSAFPVMGVAAKPKTPKPPKTDKKVVFCHRKGNGSFVRINVSRKATRAHLKHGDGYPGAAVPNQAGKWFDDACNVIEATRVQSDQPVVLEPLQWGSVSCSAGYRVVGGGFEGATSGVSLSQPAKPGVGTYPNYPPLIFFIPPEEGWVVQNGPTVQSLVIYADCLPTSP